jgi:hypothetical protein
MLQTGDDRLNDLYVVDSVPILDNLVSELVVRQRLGHNRFRIRRVGCHKSFCFKSIAVCLNPLYRLLAQFLSVQWVNFDKEVSSKPKLHYSLL